MRGRLTSNYDQFAALATNKPLTSIGLPATFFVRKAALV